MTTKAKVVEQLGEQAVLLPTLIGDALAANDRIKLRMSLLQEAASQAAAPGRQPRSFAAERKACGLDDMAYDSLVAEAHVMGPGRLHLPGAAILLAGVSEDLARMIAPLRAADPAAARPLEERAESVLNDVPAADNDQIDLRAIGDMVSATPGGHDTVHLLVMDIHKALNQLAADTAVETLDGARVHAIDDRDRRSVKAFMSGLNRTAPLAFGHPGLGTTAVRTGGHLTIQNDIGTTGAHVLIVHVEAETVRVTYTDVHRARARFFMSLFDEWKVEWTPLAERAGDGIGDEASFYLVVGTFTSQAAAKIDRFLEFLGSRIVFLIDWNKARKTLQTFVGKDVAIDLLRWAAMKDFGHRAFLELGGAELIFDTVRHAAAGRIPYGRRLDEALGAGECTTFLQHVLQDTSQGLASGRTARLIRDEIQAELSRCFETAESSAFTILVRHLGLTRMLAGAIADLLAAPLLGGMAERQALGLRAKQLEEKADRLTVAAREACTRIHQAEMLRTAIDEIEEATDTLEDCAYWMSLLPDDGVATLHVQPLIRLSATVTDGVAHFVRAVEAASHLQEGHQADATASLQSIDAVVLAERVADAAQREAFAALSAAPCADARVLVMGLEIARALETATDHLSHAALSLRDRVLEELSA